MSDEQLWESVPIISKTDIVESGMGCLSIKYMNKYVNDKLIRYRTSGSTGLYMDIYWDKYEYIKSMTSLWILRKKYYDIKPNDRHFYFFTKRTCDLNEIEYENDVNSMGISKALLCEEKMSDVYMKLVEFKPVWAMLQPSVAEMLMYVKIKYSLPDIKTLKYIELTGEILLPELQNSLKNTFNCFVANQYGCNECNSIAYECPCGNMHIMSDNVHIITDEVGSAYLTTLHNFAMPFVKYGIGDKVAVDYKSKCSCGNSNPVLTVLKGRVHEFIVKENGEKINSSCVHRAIDIINEITDGNIKQYRILQKNIFQFVVNLVTDEVDMCYEFQGLFENILSSELGYAVAADVYITPYVLPDMESGKLCSFESLVA